MTPARREVILLGGAGLAAAAAGFLVGPLLLGSGSDDRLWRAPMTDLAGAPRTLAAWRGNVLVCNFWATWCTPCVEEIPLLMASWAKHRNAGLGIVGIAVDQADKVKAFASKLSITYPILVADATGLELLREAGNASGGLPFTLVADRAGRWAHRKLGALRGPELESLLIPLLAK